MASKIYTCCLLSAIIVLAGATGVSNAKNNPKSSIENLQVVAECDTHIYPDSEIKEPVFIYRILAKEDTCSRSPTYVASNEEKSCTVVIEDVPISGYYLFRVEAGYSDSSQRQEEYYIEINDSIRSPVILDPNIKYPPSGCHNYMWAEHGVQYLNAESNTVIFHKGGIKPDTSTNSVHFKTIEITRLPNMLPEPKYTQGLSNTVCWIPTIAVDHEVFSFVSPIGSPHTPPLQLKRSIVSDTICTHIEGLDNGSTYGYYVEAYFYDGKNQRSNIVYSTQDASPPSQVKIDSLHAFANIFVDIYWQGVCDSISGVKYYRIYRLETSKEDTVAIIPSKYDSACCDTSSYYKFSDTIPDPGKSYQYRIDAIDFVGNSQPGLLSSAVVLLPSPNVEILSPFYDAPDSTRYVKGTEISICAKIFNPSLGEYKSDSVKFQAIRDSLKFFENQWQSGRKFFDSCWLPINDIACYTFQFDTALVNCGDSTVVNDTSFVNGHKYYYRAQLKDNLGNYSDWSDTHSTVQDCYPPSDISNLEASSISNIDNKKGWIYIKWNSAFDFGSGLKGYQIYRKIDVIDSTYRLIEDCNVDTTYIDDFDDIKENRKVYYWIGSVDNVGNERHTSNYQAKARSQAPPKIDIKGDLKRWEGNKYTTEDFVLLFVDFSNFDRDDISALKVNVNEVIANKEVDSVIPIALPDTTIYKLRVSAVLTDNSESNWSKPDSVIKVIKFPGTTNSPKKVIWVESLNQNYPNPFNMSTLISYSLPNEARVSIVIYNIQGQKILNLTDENKKPGSYNVIWHGTDFNGQDVASGVYVYKLNIKVENEPDIIKTRKMLFFK